MTPNRMGTRVVPDLLVRFALAAILAVLGAAAPAFNVWAQPGDDPLEGTLLASGLMSTIGGAIGTDGALYVPQGLLGEITRIDVSTGETSTFASGLPAGFPFVGIGGPLDVAFVGKTAYVLVSLVSDPLFGGTERDGIYRVDSDGSISLIADLGRFNVDNPPPLGSLDDPPPAGLFNYFLVTGLPYALERFGEGFLVSDGHLNRVLRVTRRGEVSIVQAFGNVVPTGTAIAAGQLFLAEAGPIVGGEEIGQIVSFGVRHARTTTTVATDISMAVDVQFGPHGQLYALSQGDFGGGPEGSPAAPNTGRLLRVNDDGTTTLLADELNLPTSLHFVGNTALVVTLAGEVWKFEDVGKR